MKSLDLILEEFEHDWAAQIEWAVHGRRGRLFEPGDGLVLTPWSVELCVLAVCCDVLNEATTGTATVEAPALETAVHTPYTMTSHQQRLLKLSLGARTLYDVQ